MGIIAHDRVVFINFGFGFSFCDSLIEQVRLFGSIERY